MLWLSHDIISQLTTAAPPWKREWITSGSHIDTGLELRQHNFVSAAVDLLFY